MAYPKSINNFQKKLKVATKSIKNRVLYLLILHQKPQKVANQTPLPLPIPIPIPLPLDIVTHLPTLKGGSSPKYSQFSLIRILSNSVKVERVERVLCLLVEEDGTSDL